MRFVTSSSDVALGRAFDVFRELIPEKCWVRRVANIHSEARGNPFLREMLREENEIAIALNEASQARKSGSLFPFDISTSGGYAAATLVFHVSMLLPSLSITGKQRLRRRIEGAIANSPEDICALCHEFALATHFTKRQWSVSLPELEGSGPGDVLAVSPSGLSAVVECKYMTPDKGRKVPRRSALVLHHLLEKATERLISNLDGGLLIQLRPADRLPSEFFRLKHIAKCVPAAVLGLKTMQVEGTSVTVKQFDVANSPFSQLLPSRVDVEEFVQLQTGLRNKEWMIRKSASGGVFVVQIASYEGNNLRDALLDTLRDSARRQLAGVENSLLCVKVGGLTGAELTNLARDAEGASASPNTLQLLATDFFNSQSHVHIAGVTFMADNEVRSAGGVTHQGGTAYSFWRLKEHVPAELRSCFTSLESVAN